MNNSERLQCARQLLIRAQVHLIKGTPKPLLDGSNAHFLRLFARDDISEALNRIESAANE